MKPILLLAALAVLISACDTNAREGTPYPGVLLGNDRSTPTIVAPDTVRAGDLFAVTVTTQGGGCEQQGDTRASVAGGEAVVRPFDVSFYRAGDACTAILKYFPHTTNLSFPAPGLATIRAVGSESLPAATAPADVREATAEKTIVVVAR